MPTTTRSFLPLTAAIVAALALMSASPPAHGAPSDTSATSRSTDIFSTTDGWKKDRIWYTDNKDELPTGRWDDQYMNSFGGVPVGGAGWHTWSFLGKPGAAGWTGTYDSNPYPRVDTSVGGSTATNWTQLQLYKGFIGGYYALKYTKSNANAKRGVVADNPTIAETRITDPWTMSAPSASLWSLGMDYSQFGEFSSTDANGAIWSNFGLTLNPLSSTSGSPTNYNLLSVTINANGSASVTTALNGNDAETTGNLIAGQLNGVLLLNGNIVTPAQAGAALTAMYNSTSGWQLNPNGYDITTFHPDDLTNSASVFSLSARVFLDGSTVSATVSTLDASSAIAEPSTAAVPEPAPALLFLAGLGVFGIKAWRRRR
ncbi:PEP-CTERM sorting domain-containing protein [Pelomonas sp. KK5]|uniref:PEP-CTERM sorting domain-containing protein n=1 Tax=Pelomonas sp. KK5 TaxID=1855730 RepID=UPI001301CFC0|nr:PEP-CTERM sorting domain-containing protein [Pelomonas sp. KK5]